MHRLLPELILENHRAGRRRGSFTAVGMFLDISGFSQMTDALMGQGRDGAEILASTMRNVFDRAVEAVFEQGGVVVGYAGDSFTALFPAADDELLAARSAVAAAHRIQQDLGAHPTVETPLGNFHIMGRIGLAWGEADWGILPSNEGKQAIYYFRGSAVAQAARAEHQGTGGEIILSESLAARLSSDIETQRLGDWRRLIKPLSALPGPRSFSLPPIDADASAHFVPREIIIQDLQGEFRQTVHVFMRLPEGADEELQEFVEAFFRLQRRYGGLLDHIDFGDKGCNLVIAWGAPRAHENDIDRALSLVLDLRSELSFRIAAGITYYSSYAGYIGSRLFETYAAYGWGVSMAARLMTEAPAGEVWLDQRIAARAGGRFDLTPVGERILRGFAEKQEVFLLHGRKPGARTEFRGRMVGRESELSALSEFLQPLWNGKNAGVVAIWGEAGMGKSRLAHEFRSLQSFEKRDCMWAVCQTDEILRRSFNPVRYWLSHYFDIHRGQDSAARFLRFKAGLEELLRTAGDGPLAVDLKRARPFLAALLELDWPDAPYGQLDAQGRYDNTMLALITLLKVVSLRQPLIVLIEDAHFLDADTRAFVPRLKRSLGADPISYPIAIIMTTRWEGTRVLLEEGLVDRDLDLRALGSQSVSEMARDFLGGPAAASLVNLVNERAEGNPFYTEQMLRYLREQNLLEEDSDGRWILKTRQATTKLPSDISAMLLARLDRLPSRVRGVVHAASVLGRVFELAVLKRMFPDADTFPNEVAAAEQAAIWSPFGESRYIFNHQLLRDVAYNMQLHTRLQELHREAFQALLEILGDQKLRHNGALAHHCERAGMLNEARHYLRLAADAARDAYHNAEALDYYRRALAIHAKPSLHEDYLLHRECEKLVAELGLVDERLAEIEVLQSLADALVEPGCAAEVMLLRSNLMAGRGDYDSAETTARRAKELAFEAGRMDVALGAYRCMLQAFYGRGMYKQAVESGEAGLALARELGASDEEAHILNWLGLVVLETKNPSSARTYYEQSLSIFRAQDNVRGAGRVLTNLGSVAGYQGNYAAALDYYEQSVRLAREIGSRHAECLRLGNLGWVCGLLGDHPQARAHIELSLRIAREIGDQRTELFSLINLSSHSAALGELSAALTYADQGLAMARLIKERNAAAWALTYRGHAHLESGHLDEARESYSEALALRESMEQAVLATEPAAGLARICLSEGDLLSAMSHVNTILSQLEQDGSLEGTDEPLRIYLGCYLVLSRASDPRADGLLNAAHDLVKTRANGISDPASRARFLRQVTYNRQIMSLWDQRHETRASSPRQ